MATRGGGCVRVVVLVVAIPIVLGLGLLLASNVSRIATHDTATGVIVELLPSTDSDGDLTYTPVYEYRVNGDTYRYQSQVSYGGVVVPDIGDTRTILFDPGNPADARVRNVFILIWLPIILMVIPVLVVVLIFWAMRRRQRMADAAPPWADQIPAEQPEWAGPPQTWQPPTGAAKQPIEAVFMGTEPSQMDEQGKVRYRVKARAEIDGEVHRFRSEWVDEDPTLYYMQHGNRVEVHVDPADPTVYEVLLPPID